MFFRRKKKEAEQNQELVNESIDNEAVNAEDNSDDAIEPQEVNEVEETAQEEVTEEVAEVEEESKAVEEVEPQQDEKMDDAKSDEQTSETEDKEKKVELVKEKLLKAAKNEAKLPVERRSQICKYFLDGDHDAILRLNLQELIYAHNTALFYRDKNSKSQADFELYNKYSKDYYGYFIDKLKKADKIYAVFSEQPAYPFISGQAAWIFTREDFCDDCIEFFKGQFITLKKIELDNKKFLNHCTYLHILGCTELLVDNGQFKLTVKIDEIVKKPDFTNVPVDKQPIVNPDLQRTLITFYQFLAQGRKVKLRKEIMMKAETDMLAQVIEAKYLVPAIVEKTTEEAGAPVVKPQQKTNMKFPVIQNNKGEKFIPAFTDWIEFQKRYKKGQFAGVSMKYADLLKVTDNLDGFAINPFGVNMVVNKSNMEAIERFKEDRLKKEEK